MKISIIGVGVVGSALSTVLKHWKHKVYEFDLYKNLGTFEGVLDSDILFLCLPTLYNSDLKEYNKDSINETFRKLSEADYQGKVVLKSTVEPGVTDKLSEKYTNLRVFHNPEFLTARTNIYDFFFQDHIVIGTTSHYIDQEEYTTELLELYEFFKNNWNSAKISVCTSLESETMKIGCNVFYSIKVQFFNELYLLCQKQGTDYQKVRNLMIDNKLITGSHTQVPGHDGKLSYGGVCFPKDTNALLQHMKKLDVPCKVLEGTINERNEMRES
jgi:UDPglucose 6-dehydrogenase